MPYHIVLTHDTCNHPHLYLYFHTNHPYKDLKCIITVLHCTKGKPNMSINQVQRLAEKNMF